MNNKKWLTRLTRLLATTVSLMCTTSNAQNNSYYPIPEPAFVNNTQQQNAALPWWNERSMSIPEVQPYSNQKPRPGITPEHNYSRPQNKVRVQAASYRQGATPALQHNQSCQSANAYSLPDHCIQRPAHNRRGLVEQIKYLRRLNPQQSITQPWGTVSNATLLATASELLQWNEGYSRVSFLEKFNLHKISAHNPTGKANYTGYFTPVVQVQSYRDENYRFPVYAAPQGGTRLSRREIDNGGLSGRNLEIAWTNDKANLFFAHTQGSAIASYPDGTKRYLGYAGNNQHNYVRIRHILRHKGYMVNGLSNENIRRWLHANPQHMDKVLHTNPRYIFFSLSERLPSTATGSSVLPGHTLAVDDNYIPLGAVLLAEVPRVDHLGERVGSDWRLLFAQDRGNDIKGPGRIDMYTGMGRQAEAATYRVTGLYQTYMLTHKLNHNNNFAGM